MSGTDRPLAGRNALPGAAPAISALTLGTNTFGWTSSPQESFAVLDRFVELGGTSVDTADVYSFWGDGNEGGESERVIGDWLRRSGARDDIVLATKVGFPGGRFGDRGSLAPEELRVRLEGSLERLGCDRVDVLYLHREDPEADWDEVVAALDGFRSQGLVGAIGVSNFSAAGLEAFHAAAQASAGGSVPVMIQSHWSLLNEDFEQELLPLCQRLGVAAVPFWGLEKGFLTGKYRDRQQVAQTERQLRHRPFDLFDARGARVLGALDEVAGRQGVPVAAAALAWLLHQPMTPSVVASARTADQLDDLAALAQVALSPQDLAILAQARQRRDEDGVAG